MDRGQLRSKIAPAPLLVLVAILSVGVWSCGTERTRPKDAGETDGQRADSGSTPLACDPSTQDCPVGMKCDFFCNGTAPTVGCRPDNGGGAALDSDCSGSAPCKKGSGCFATGSSAPTCRRYCDADGDCAAGSCQTATIAVACGGGAPTNLSMKVCF